VSNYLSYRQQIAQGLIAKEGKKAPSSKKEKAAGGIITLDEWFLECRKQMTGKCWHCGGATPKYDDFSYKASIAHILPKRGNMFPSIETHPDNWIELCSWGNNCHGNYDNSILDLMQLNCFDLVIERFIRIYPAIAPKERRNIPDVLLQYAKDAI
jgi:hypothetical protein